MKAVEHLVAMILALGLGVPALASVPGESASRIAEKIEASKNKVEREEKSRRRILSALYEINRKLRKTTVKKSKLRMELIGLEENIKRSNDRLTELQQSSGQLKARLAERLKAMHRLGGASFMRILFAANNPAELERNLRILGTLGTRDRDAIKTYQKLSQDISRRQERLVAREAQLRLTEQNLREQEKAYIADQGLKSRLLSGVRKKHLFALRDLRRLKEETRRAGYEDGLMESLLKPSFSEQRGKLERPLKNGFVSRPFGVENAGENSWTLVHKGIRWSAPPGEPVSAVFDGRVVWVGDLPQAGQTVVVDHGDHYYTVYSELNETRVTEGQDVLRGEVIAQVGRSTLEDGPGMHFEIRHFSEPDDPQPWMKGSVL